MSDLEEGCLETEVWATFRLAEIEVLQTVRKAFDLLRPSLDMPDEEKDELCRRVVQHTWMISIDLIAFALTVTGMRDDHEDVLKVLAARLQKDVERAFREMDEALKADDDQDEDEE